MEKSIAAIALLERTEGSNQETTNFFKERVEQLFSPNVRHGVVSIDKAHVKTDDIPLVVTRYPEVYSTDESFRHLLPSQLEIFQETYQDDAFVIHALQAMIAAKPDTISTMAHEGLRGSASYRFWKSEKEEKIVELLCRPLIQINNAHTQTTKASTASILFHEFVHTDQYRRTPVITTDNYHTPNQSLSRELEAYDKQHSFIQELIKTNDPLYKHPSLCTPYFGYISKACDLNPPESRYTFTDESITHLKKRDIEIFRPLWTSDKPDNSSSL